MEINPEVVFKRFQEATQLKPKLDILEVSVINCILYKAIEKLMIVKELLQGPEKTEPIGRISPAVKIIERETFVAMKTRLPDNILQLQQIKVHINFLLDLFEETLIELKFLGSQVYLEYTLCCENLKLYHNQMIIHNNKNDNKLINYLLEKLKNHKHKTQQYLLQSTGPCLDKSIVNNYVEEKLGTQYGRVREVTRTEKNVLRLKENERVVQEANDKLNFEVKEEDIIHREIKTHLSLLLAELTNKVEFWTNKYNTEINQLDIDLLQMKSQKDEHTKALETLLQEFSEKKEIMVILKAEHIARERESKQKLLEIKAIHKIQRWWRNILLKINILKQNRTKSSKNNVKTLASKKKSKK